MNKKACACVCVCVTLWAISKLCPHEPHPLVHYQMWFYMGKCRLVHSTCRMFGIRRCPLFGSRKCTASKGIAVGTSTVVRYTEEVRYWEGPLSEVPLYFLSFCFFHAQEVFIFIFPTQQFHLNYDQNKMSWDVP